MGANSSTLNTWRSEVCLAVQASDAERLYQLFMLATRHQLGLVQVTSSNISGAAVGMATDLIAKFTTSDGSDRSIGIDEYLRTLTGRTSDQGYVAFSDGPARPSASNQSNFNRPSISSSPSAPHSNMASISGPVIANPAAPQSTGYFSSISSLFGSKNSSPKNSSPYATLAAAPSNKPATKPAPPNNQSPAYAPPALKASLVDETANDRPLQSTGSQLLDQSQSSQNNQQYNNSQPSYSPPGNQPVFQSNSVAPNSTAEFSANTLPVSVNTMWIGDDSLLIFAAKQDQTSIIHLLHQAGADLEYSDPTGWSALHHAAAYGCVRSVKALLDIGSDALAHSKLGLTPAQCSTHPEIRRELETEEMARRHGVEQQLRAITEAQSRLPNYGGPVNAMSMPQRKIPSVFHVSLYQVVVPVEVRSGSRFEVQYRAPPRHSPSDCLCVYYCDEKKPYEIRARIGCSVPVPDKPPQAGQSFSKLTMQAEDKMLKPGTYRLLYYNATEASFPAASNMFRVIAAPNAKSSSSSLSSWFDPAAWRPDASSQPINMSDAQSATPIILHPNFAELSDLSPHNLESYLEPLPPYFTFSYQMNAHAVRLALELDGRLYDCRERLVPSRMTEKDFWAAYWYKMIATDAVEKYNEKTRQTQMRYHAEQLDAREQSVNQSASHAVNQQEHDEYHEHANQPRLLSFSAPMTPTSQFTDGPIEESTPHHQTTVVSNNNQPINHTLDQYDSVTAPVDSANPAPVDLHQSSPTSGI